jgi:ElaB/YqjD/DUF883 family membrane-anchored ribosome-binding protein
MDHETAVIREQMDETRSALTDKLETLEHQVADTVQETTAAVTETVENVTEAVQDTVAKVTGTVTHTVDVFANIFNVKRHVDRHPWPMMGGSVAVGYLLEMFLGGARSGRAKRETATKPRPPEPVPARNGSPWKAGPEPESVEAAPAAAPQARGHGWLSGIGEKLAPELAKLKGLVLGTIAGTARDLVTKTVSGELGQHLGHLIDDVTTKLGGEVFPSHIDPASADGPTEENQSERLNPQKTAKNGPMPYVQRF